MDWLVACRPVPELMSIAIHNTKLHTLYVPLLSNSNPCKLPIYYASTYPVRRPTAGPATWEAKRVWQNKLILYVLPSYVIVRIIPTINTWYFVMDIDYLIQQQQYEYTTVYIWHYFTFSIFGTTTAVTTAAVVVVLTTPRTDQLTVARASSRG